jgi:hypothetical protein
MDSRNISESKTYSTKIIGRKEFFNYFYCTNLVV